MTTEYGIFTDEGCIEANFFSRAEAEAAIKIRYPEEECHVAEVCIEHPEEEREHCSRCMDDNEDEETEEEA